MSVRSTYNNFERILVLPENFKFIHWGSIFTLNMQPAIPTTELLTANVYISHHIILPELADVSAAAGSSLISLGSTGRAGPLRGGTGKSSGWERSVSASFNGVLLLLSSTTQSSCSSEGPNTLLSSEQRKAAEFREDRLKTCNSGNWGSAYHDQHLGYQSLIAWTSSAQQLVITKPTCTWKTVQVN